MQSSQSTGATLTQRLHFFEFGWTIKEKADYSMLEALKSLEIDNTSHFQELNGDVSSFCARYSFHRISRPSPDNFLSNHPGIAQIFSL
jgi:hypothetical protein